MGSKQFARLIGGVALACSTLALATPPITAPAWRDLTPAQQRTLAPLAKEWQDLPDERKRKWAGIADRFPRLHAGRTRPPAGPHANLDEPYTGRA